MTDDDDEALLGTPRDEKPDPEPATLRALLLKACPPDPRNGHVTMRRLASLMTSEDKPQGITDEALFKWCRANKIPPGQANRIVDLSEGRVTLSDFIPFVFL